MEADNPNATVWNILVSHEKLSDQVPTHRQDRLEKRADLVLVHKEAEAIKLESQKAAASPIPFHPGAVKYFTERASRSTDRCGPRKEPRPEAGRGFFLPHRPRANAVLLAFSRYGGALPMTLDRMDGGRAGRRCRGAEEGESTSRRKRRDQPAAGPLAVRHGRRRGDARVHLYTGLCDRAGAVLRRARRLRACSSAT